MIPIFIFSSHFSIFSTFKEHVSPKRNVWHEAMDILIYYCNYSRQ